MLLLAVTYCSRLLDDWNSSILLLLLYSFTIYRFSFYHAFRTNGCYVSVRHCTVIPTQTTSNLHEQQHKQKRDRFSSRGLLRSRRQQIDIELTTKTRINGEKSFSSAMWYNLFVEIVFFLLLLLESHCVWSVAGTCAE